MRVAFATTCKGRLEHLSRTLPQNLASNADYRDCVFVVLDYGSTDALRRYVAQSGESIDKKHLEHRKKRRRLARLGELGLQAWLSVWRWMWP